MARLRTLYVGTKTVGDIREEQHILILDRLTADQLQNDFEAFEGAPKILAFGFDVDIPGADAARWVMPDSDGQTAQDAINRLKGNAEAARWPRVEIGVSGDAEATQDVINRLRNNAEAAGVPDDLVP